LESFDAAGRINELLFAREKGMTVGTDLQVNLGLRGSGTERLAACASDNRFDVFRMDTLFHIRTL
jgi:hypothetical protein